MDLGHGIYVDGSWELSILVEDLQIVKRIRVSGETHIGGVMLKLVEAIDVKLDWSDHGLWWPERNCWLLKTRQTLDQNGVQADAKLEFHRMHNWLRLQLPDLQEKELRVNFSQTVFSVVMSICKDLGIRHPEELSLKRRIDTADFGLGGGGGGGDGYAYSVGTTKSSRFSSMRRSRSINRNGGNDTMDSRKRLSNNRRSDAFNPLVPKAPSMTAGTLPYGNGADSLVKSPGSPRLGESANLMSPMSINSLAFEGADESYLANSPHVPLQTALTEKGLQRLRSNTERAMLSVTWLDSSKSLMEQGVRPGCEEELLLRFKYFAFYDLNIKYDAIRINQIYEQVKWSLLTEEIDCTDEEMMLLAALQLQGHLQANDPQRATSSNSGAAASAAAAAATVTEEDTAADDEIDAALADLEMSLMSDAHYGIGNLSRQQSEQQHLQQKQPEVREVPELSGYLKFFKPKRFTLKNYKRYFFALRDTTLYLYPDQAAASQMAAFVESFNLKNAEVVPDLNMTTRKFGIRLFILTQSGLMQEVWLRCETKDQYAQWVAAISLASRGKTLASKSLYDSELKETLTRLDMQAPRPQPMLTVDSMPNIDVADFVALRCLKKHKSRALLQGILERHANVRSLNLLESKLEYIRTWQRLPMHGVAYFLVNYTESRSKPMTFSEFRKERRKNHDALFGVAFNRIMRLDVQTGDILNTWRYQELASWTVNWEVMSFRLTLNRPPHEMTLVPSPFFASRLSVCKTLAEMVGGYVFLSLRKPDRSQEINEQMFHRLTGSRDHQA
ncbi:hypothetical protein BOX15_Mlig007286g3 [Macrostomum lignano]|uniref:PH domain-containing protein n=1 Tax=Macrostomum lignano TaxID=282301 RepID=A0A267DJG1_9PLAT|nr:hypothetical protein BOX15_Mlig007286g3 [Macrostomum lignano]